MRHQPCAPSFKAPPPTSCDWSHCLPDALLPIGRLSASKVTRFSVDGLPPPPPLLSPPASSLSTLRLSLPAASCSTQRVYRTRSSLFMPRLLRSSSSTRCRSSTSSTPIRSSFAAHRSSLCSASTKATLPGSGSGSGSRPDSVHHRTRERGAYTVATLGGACGEGNSPSPSPSSSSLPETSRCARALAPGWYASIRSRPALCFSFVCAV